MDNDENSDYESDKNEKYQSYVSIPYGLQLLSEYSHSSKHCDIQDITHNTKTNEYIILDSRGISSWTNNVLSNTTRRLLDFDAYKFNTLRSVVYSRHYNVYFALAKEYNLKVYNLNFHELSTSESDGSSVSRLLYNAKRNELITVCRNKLRFWKYSFGEQNTSTQNIKLLREFKVAESLLVSNAEFDNELQRIYLLCDNDIWCYNIEGRCLFHLESESATYFSVCTYSKEANLVIAGSINGQLNIFTQTGGLVTTLLNHSRLVTAVVVHPKDGNMFISASMDGTIKLFSLQMLGELCSINTFPDGVYWMKIRSNNELYCASRKSLHLYDLNYTFQFWSTVRCPVNKMSIIQKQAKMKSYVLVNTTDTSIRLYSKQNGNKKCTILPPPEVRAGYDVISTAFDRMGRALYILFNPSELWIYSTRTDPATRVATWNIEQSVKIYKEKNGKSMKDSEQQYSCNKMFGMSTVSQRKADENVKCCSLASIRRNIYIQDVQLNDFLNFGYLLCGLSNGTVAFLDPCDQGNVFTSFKAHSTSPVEDLRVYYGALYTHLLTRIHTITDIMIKIWDAVTFSCIQEIQISSDITVFAYKEWKLAVGHSKGYLMIKTIELNKQPKDIEHHSMKDHNGAILSVDILEGRNIVSSCGTDFYIRIWNESKILLTEIKFDETLQSAIFLKQNGALLISFKSQLFVVPHYIVFYGSSGAILSSPDSSGDESFVYEDPFVRKGYKTSKQPLKTTLSNYLVPYPSLGLEALWMFQKAIMDQESEEEDFTNKLSDDSDSDSLKSFASTSIYQDSVTSEMSLTKLMDEIEFPRCNSTPLDEENIVCDSEEEGKIDNFESTEVLNLVDVTDKKDCIPKEETINQTLSLYDQIRSLQVVKDPVSSSKSKQKKNKSHQMNVNNQFSSDTTKSKQKIVRKKKTKKYKAAKKLSSMQNTDESEKTNTTKDSQAETTRLKSESIKTDAPPDDKLTSKIVLQSPTSNNQNHNGAKKDGKEVNNGASKINVESNKPISKKGHSKQNLLSTKAVMEKESLSLNQNHHKSLSAMSMGKSERVVSHSYQNVMKSLLKSNDSMSVKSTKSMERPISNESITDYNLESPMIKETISTNTQRNPSRSVIKANIPEQVGVILQNQIQTCIRSPLVASNEEIKSKTVKDPMPKTAMPKTKLKTEAIDIIKQPSLDVSEPSASFKKSNKSTSSKLQRNEVPAKKSTTNGYNQSNNTFKPNITVGNMHSTDEKTLTSITNTAATSMKLLVTVPSENFEIDTHSATLTTQLATHKVKESTNEGETKETETNTKNIEKPRKSLKAIIQKHFLSKPNTTVPHSVPRKSKDVTTVILNLSTKLKIKREEEQKKARCTQQVSVGVKDQNSSQQQSDFDDFNNNIIMTTKTIKSTITTTTTKNSNITTQHQTSVFMTDKDIAENINEAFTDAVRIPQTDPVRKNIFVSNINSAPQKPLLVRKQSSEVFKVKTDKNSSIQQLSTDGEIAIKSTSISANNTVEVYEEELDTSLVQDNVVKQHVMSFILGAFKKPKLPLYEKRNLTTESEHSVQERESTPDINIEDPISQNESILLSEDSFYSKHSMEYTHEKQSKITMPSFITPRNSISSLNNYSPISSVIIHQNSPDQNDRSLIESNSVLSHRLKKHKYTKDRRRFREQKIEMQRSNSAPSSGYNTASQETLLKSNYKVRRTGSSSLSKNQTRLTIKRSPLVIDESDVTLQQTPIQRDSETVYYDYSNSIKTPKQNHQNCNNVEEKKRERIRDLEVKLSGQRHRYHTIKPAKELENDLLTLMFMQERSAAVVFPVPKSSASIPIRCQYKLVKDVKESKRSSKMKRSQKAMINECY